MATRITWEEVKSVVTELIETSTLRGEPLGSPIVLLGGSALAAHGAREDSLDVDLYIPAFSRDVVHDVESTLKLRYGPQFRLDVTRTENIWGVVMLRDIAASPIKAEVVAAGRTHSILALRIEDLFLLKLLADRPKDRPDRALLCGLTTADALISRFNTLLDWYGTPGGEMSFADAFVTELQERFGMEPMETIARLAVARYVRLELEAAYGDRPSE